MACTWPPTVQADDVDHHRVRAVSERMFYSLQVRRLTSLRGMPDMLVTQAYRFALDPTPQQARAMASHCGAARFAFNC
jgi:hypothetical protein